MEKVLLRIILVVFIANSVIGLFFVKKVFIDQSSKVNVAEASVKAPLVYTKNELPTSVSLQNELDVLTLEGLDPVARRKIIRPLFEGNGRVITIDGDSLEVFEYNDKKTAEEKLTKIEEAYTNSAWSDIYKRQIHLYLKNNLGIYYLGNDEKIISALDKTSDSNFPIKKLQ